MTKGKSRVSYDEDERGLMCCIADNLEILNDNFDALLAYIIKREIKI